MMGEKAKAEASGAASEKPSPSSSNNKDRRSRSIMQINPRMTSPLSLFAYIRAYAIRPYSLRRKTKYNDTFKERIPRQMNGKYVGRKGVKPL